MNYPCCRNAQYECFSSPIRFHITVQAGDQRIFTDRCLVKGQSVSEANANSQCILTGEQNTLISTIADDILDDVIDKMLVTLYHIFCMYNHVQVIR